MEGEQPSSAQTNGQPQDEPPPLEVNPAPSLGEPVSLAKTCAEGRSVYQLQQNYQREIVRIPGEQFILENRQPQDGCQVVEMLSYGTLFLEENKRTGEIQYLAGTPPRATMAEARIAQYYWPAFYRCLRFHQMLENESGDLITHPMPACWNDPDTTGTLSNFVNTPFVDDYVRQQDCMRQEAEPVVKVEPPDSPIQDAEMCDVSLPGQPSDNKIKSGERDSSGSEDESDSSSSDDTDSSSKKKVAHDKTKLPTLSTTTASDSVANCGNTRSKQIVKLKLVESTSVWPTTHSLPTQSTQSTKAKQTSAPRAVASTSSTLPLAPQFPIQSLSSATLHPLQYMPAAYPEQPVFLQPWSMDLWSSAPSTSAGTSGAHSFLHAPAELEAWQQEAAAPVRTSIKLKLGKPTAMDQDELQRLESKKKEIVKQRHKERRRQKRVADAIARKAAGQGMILQSPAWGVQHQVRCHSRAQRDFQHDSLPPVPTGVWHEPYPRGPKPPRFKK